MTTHDHHILVIDDDQDIRDVLAELLEEAGYRVLRAASGDDGLALLRRGAPVCAVLLDLMMPGMNGWQFRAEQLADPAIANIPVIVITASGASRDGLGEVVLIRKPLRLPAIVDVVKEHCPGP